jgi:hypothetical protein
MIDGGNHTSMREEVSFRHTMHVIYVSKVHVKKEETYAISYTWKGEQVSHVMKMFVNGVVK